MLKGIMSGSKETRKGKPTLKERDCGDLYWGHWDEGAKKCKDSEYVLEAELVGLVDELDIGYKI